jgi:hypothetical protein
MRILHKDPPPAQAKNSHSPGQQHWSPGEPYPHDRQPDALEALERNARAADEAFKREQIAAARRMRRAA